MNLRRSHSYQRRWRAALSALETPSLTSAAVLGSAAWVGTAIPAAAILAPRGSHRQGEVTMSLRSAVLGIDDNAAGFGITKSAIGSSQQAGLPTLERFEALRDRRVTVQLGVRARPIVVQIEPAATQHQVP